jgi:hypothetical protein
MGLTLVDLTLLALAMVALVCPGGLVGLVLWPRMALTLMASALVALSFMALALEASVLALVAVGLGGRDLEGFGRVLP